jgi:hypothetical protein
MARKSLENKAGKIILTSAYQSFISGDIRIDSIWNKIKQSTKNEIKNKKTQRNLGIFGICKIRKLLKHINRR